MRVAVGEAVGLCQDIGQWWLRPWHGAGGRVAGPAAAVRGGGGAAGPAPRLAAVPALLRSPAAVPDSP